MYRRGEIWWAWLPPPIGSEPGYTHPVVVLQGDRFNQSAISTVIIVSMTSNLWRADAPGNVLVPSAVSGLTRDSVVNVSQILAIDKDQFLERVGSLPSGVMAQIDTGVRLILSL